MAATPTIQSGVITLANGAASVTVDRGVDPGFDTAVDLDATFPTFFQRAGASASTDQVADQAVTVVLTDPDTITITRAGTVGDVIIEWTLTSYTSGVRTFQRTITMTGTASGTATVSAPLGGSYGRWIIPLGTRGATTLERGNRHCVRLDFNPGDNTQVRGVRTTGTGDVVASFCVVEHDGATVQTITTPLSATTNTTEDATVSAVTVAATAVWATQQCSSTVGQASTNWRYALSSTTNLRYTRVTGTALDFTFTAFVVSFTDGTVVAAYAPAHADGTGTVNTTVTSVDLTRAIVVPSASWVPSMGECTNAAWNRSCCTADLTTATNLQTVKGVTTTAATPTLQVVEFAEGTPPVGPVVDPTSGTTNGSGVLATDLTSDVPDTRVLTTARVGGTVVGYVTTIPT